MSEVRKLPVERVKQHAAPHQPLIDMLERMLESAKKGELQSVACACVYADDLEPGGAVSHGIQIAPYTRYAMSYAMGELTHKLTLVLHGD